MTDEILYNSPALHALKRHQLMSLSKRYGLKASGKNVDMIDRLRECLFNYNNRPKRAVLIPDASTRSPDNSITLPLPAPTPAPGRFPNNGTNMTESPSPTRHKCSPLEDVSDERRLSAMSDKWEVLSASGASLLSPAKNQRGMTKSSSVSSWKSAANGEPLSDFGVDEQLQPIPARSKPSKSSSIRSIASSLSRRASLASQHLMSRSTSASSNLTVSAAEFDQAEQAGEVHQSVQPCPPSPASTVGIPRRYSKISLLEKPSTIRLVSPEPTPMRAGSDDLPFFSPPQVKQRRSMAPLRGSKPPQAPAAAMLTRKSMPAMSAAAATPTPMFASVYPPLPVGIPPVPPIPGAYKTAPSVSPDRANRMTISNAQFEDAGKQVLAEMEAKMRATLGDRGISFGEELLKGKKAEVNRLVSVREGLGEGGWGLRNMASSTSIQDRYAAAHQKEFARMKSIDGQKMTASKHKTTSSNAKTIVTSPSKTTLDWGASSAVEESESPKIPGKRKLSTAALNTPSAPNGAPLVDDGERQQKRSRLSPGPNAFGSLRMAGRSLANLIGEATPAKKKRRSSLKTNRGLAHRFGLFRPKHSESLTTPTVSSAQTTIPRSTTTSSFAIPTAPLNPTVTANSSTLQSSATSRSTTVPGNQSVKDRGRSASAQSTMSVSSRGTVRPRLPEFGGGSTLSRSGSVNALGQPKSMSGSTTSHSALKKQSHADIIRSARPAPAPPAVPVSSVPSSEALGASTTSMKRTSTLFNPTASSLARKQATVRPTADRPLPVIPASTTVKPFGNTSTRTNVEAGSSAINAMTPHKLNSALKATPTASPARIPGKSQSSSALRVRQKASGLSAVKPKGNLRAEKEVEARLAAIRAKQQRIGQERELREMLGGGPGAIGGIDHDME